MEQQLSNMTQCMVLAVDNSEDDLTLLQLAFCKAVPSLPLKTLDSGEEAIRYINGEGKYSNRQTYPVPRLILLDLKMPRVSGFEVLQAIRARYPSEAPFVVVLSSSQLSEDIEKATQLGATAFHTKPINFEQLCDLVRKLAAFFCMQPSRDAELKSL